MLQQRITRRPRRRKAQVDCPPLRTTVPAGAGPDGATIEELLARIDQLVERQAGA